MPPEGCRAGACWAYWVDSMPCFSLQIDDIGPFAGIGRTRIYADLCHISTGPVKESIRLQLQRDEQNQRARTNANSDSDQGTRSTSHDVQAEAEARDILWTFHPSIQSHPAGLMERTKGLIKKTR